jgi:hypothetical protein
MKEEKILASKFIERTSKKDLTKWNVGVGVYLL